VVTLVVFATTTLAEDPPAVVALVVILLLSIGLDLWWRSVRARRAPAGTAGPGPSGT
jgi:hypothetical protein